MLLLLLGKPLLCLLSPHLHRARNCSGNKTFSSWFIAIPSFVFLVWFGFAFSFQTGRPRSAGKTMKSIAYGEKKCLSKVIFLGG